MTGGYNNGSSPVPLFADLNLRYGLTNQPLAHAATLGTGSAAVLNPLATRRRVMFFNASQTHAIAFCPAEDASGNPLAAVVNGAGSYTLQPGQYFIVDGGGIGWNAAAASANTPLTIWEFTA